MHIFRSSWRIRFWASWSCDNPNTCRRLARSAGAFSTFSRIDRIYTSAHPSTLAQYSVQAWVKGDLSTRTSPSDHRAVEVDIRPSPPPPGTETQDICYYTPLLSCRFRRRDEHLHEHRENGCQVRRNSSRGAMCTAQSSADHPTRTGPAPTHSRRPLPTGSDAHPLGTHPASRPNRPRRSMHTTRTQ